MNNNIKKRSTQVINLNLYDNINVPEIISKCNLNVPKNRQYVLRMLIKDTFSPIFLPSNLQWCYPIIEEAFINQKRLGITHSFVYLTVRNGIVTSKTDDVWHVDGFSTNITHIPEQNYIWTNCYPTEYLNQSIKIPKDFNPKIHNLHTFFQSKAKEINKTSILSNWVYCLDPYVIHRRPKLPQETNRCFVRVSFCPIEIRDVNNTINPCLIRNNHRDGVKDFRNKLINYESRN